MKEYSKKNIAHRIVALALALMMCVTCANSDVYNNFANAVFNSNESQSLVANAAGSIHPGTGTYYDCGTFTLKGSTTDTSGVTTTLTDGWDVSNVTTYIQADSQPTLANTTGLGTTDTNAKIVCYSQYLGGLQNAASTGNVTQTSTNVYNSKDVTDYKAPAAPSTGLSYYYIAKATSTRKDNGTTTDTSDDYDDVSWVVYAWPMSAGNAISYSNQDGLAAEWTKLEADESLTASGSEVATSVSDSSTLTSLFGKSRPEWSSGNIKYTDWINMTLPSEGTSASGVATAVAGGKNEVWNSSTLVSAGTSRPWLSLTVHYNGTGTSADDVDGITVAEYPLGTTYPTGVASDGFYRYALGTTGLADKGDAKNHIAMSASTNHESPINVSAVEGGSTTVNYSIITTLSTLWSNAVHFNAAGYLRKSASEDYSYFTTATSSSDSTGNDETGKNTSVEYNKTATEDSTIYKTGDTILTPYYTKYSDITMDSARTQIVKDNTNDSHKTTYNTTGAPTGARLYGIMTVGLTSGSTTNTQVFDWETATSSLKSSDATKNFDELLTNGVDTINVTPVYDITYDYQRAAGTVSAQIPAADPTLDTTATDKTTGTHTGLVSSSAGIVDIVSYDKLVIGHEYELDGQLYTVGDGNATTIISGAKATSTFTATDTDGFVGMNFTYNNTKYAGQTVVVYETLVDKTTGITVAEHKDATDEDQKIYYPSLTTKVNIPVTGMQSSEPMDDITITDAISFSNLVVGDNYKVEGKLVDASTGSVVKTDGKDVTSTLTFAATSATESKSMEFKNVDLSDYAGKSIVVYQYLSLVNGSKSTIVYTANSKTDADETITLSNPTIETTLAETDTDLKHVTPDTNVKLTDKVSYTDLSIGSGVDYVSVTQLYNADTKNALLDKNGKTITAESSISDNTSATWDTVNNMTFDGSNLENVTVVAYNYLYRVIDGKRYLVASEEDATNADQTITMPTGATLDTVATVTTGAGSSNKIALISSKVSITDAVTYYGLNVGTNYTLTTTLYDKTAAAFVSGVSQDTTVTPTKMNDSVSVTFNVDTSALAGHELVVYQELKEGSTVVAKHQDATNKNQTITVATPSLDTVALGATTEDHTIPAITTTNIVDTVSYTGLAVGSSYTLTSKVYDADTGKLVSSISSVKTTLKPTSSDGKVEVTLKVPASTLVGKKLVVFEYLTLDGNDVASHADIDDEDQTVTVVTPSITTKATDTETGKKKLNCMSSASIDDVVTYSNLEPNTSYSLSATVYNKSTGKQITDVKTVTKTFTTGSEPSGEVTVTIPVDTSELAGKKIVVYEELKLGTVVIASHADINDDNQTVEIANPTIKTEATSNTTGNHTIPWATSTVINDKVTYTNLAKGQAYTLTTDIYDKATGKSILSTTSSSNSSSSSSSSSSKNTTTFTPESSDGSVTASVTINSSNYLGHTLVVYETLKIGSTTLVKHEDINDGDQTVYVVNPSISTVALDSATGTHMMTYGTEAAIKDTVYYSGLCNGESYTLTSTVYDRSTGLQVSGISAVSTSFTATGYDGSTQVTIPVDTTKFGGKKLVVYETLSLGGSKNNSSSSTTSSSNTGTTSIKHESLTDDNQTVFVGTASTVFMNSTKTSHSVGVSKTMTAVDTVTFSGLIPGRTYTITGQVMNADAVSKSSSTSNSSTTSTSTATIKTNNAGNSTTSTSTTDSDEISVGATKNTTNSSSNSSNTSTTNGNSTTSTTNSNSNTSMISNGNTTTTTSTNGNTTTTTSTSNDTNTSTGSNVTNDTNSTNSNSTNSSSNSSNTSNSSSTSTYVYGSNMSEVVGTTTITFVPTANSGSIDVIFTVDTRDLQNHKLVAYETITDTSTGAVVAEHKDITDSNQTITVGSSSHANAQTGVNDYTKFYMILAILALLAVAVGTGFFAFKKKKN